MRFLGWETAAAKWSDAKVLERTDGFDFNSHLGRGARDASAFLAVLRLVGGFEP